MYGSAYGPAPETFHSYHRGSQVQIWTSIPRSPHATSWFLPQVDCYENDLVPNVSSGALNGTSRRCRRYTGPITLLRPEYGSYRSTESTLPRTPLLHLRFLQGIPPRVQEQRMLPRHLPHYGRMNFPSKTVRTQSNPGLRQGTTE